MRSNDPLHGVTLETILNRLVDHYGWNGLAKRIDINCFKSDPSIRSSLKFLRRTPWARKQVEDLFVSSRLPRNPTDLAVAETLPSAETAPPSLQQYELEYRALFDLNLLGVFITRPDGRILDANPAACAMLGMTRDEICAAGRNGLVEPKAELITALSERDRTGKAAVELTMIRKDGTRFPAFATSALIPDATDGPHSFVIVEDLTMRKKMEESLLRTQFVVDNSQDLVHWMSPEGRFLYVNNASCRRLGYSREELLGMTVNDIDPRAPRPWSHKFEEFKARGSYTFESTHRTKDGDTYPVEVTVNYVDYEGQEQICAFVRDVTERKRAEKALRASEGRYRATFDANPNPMWVVDGDTLQFLSVNDAATAHYGYSRDEFLSMTLKDIRPTDGLPRPQQAAAATRESPADRGLFETRHRKRDGTFIDVEVASHPLDIAGRNARLVIPHDITERKRAEEALRQSQHLLAEAQVVANLGSYVMDIPAGWWTSSDVLDVLFGIGRSYGRSTEGWLALVHPDDRAMMSDYFANEVLGRGRSFDKEYRIVRHGDQAERWVHGLGRLEFDDQGRPVKMFGTIQDITERKRTEEILRASEERLRQSQRLEAVGSLAGGISHDFNNLLTVIIGQTEILRESPHTSEEHRDHLDEIRAVADRAATLTRQLLAFSRRQALRPRIFSMNDVAESMTGLLKRVLGEDIHLVFREDPSLWPVEADPGQLEQVIINLAVNARDAMPEGGELTIETANVQVDQACAARHSGTQAGDHVLLVISDTGRGMDEETLSHIFEPFFTTKSPEKGTGLGLSTVYGIVKQSSGNIWVYSEPGRGTTFKIYLPRADKPVDWSPAESAGMAAVLRRGTEAVLVVEDEPSVRHLTTRILAGHGYQVLAAGSPNEAIALVDEHLGDIDLILSDVILPGMSGRAMVELLLGRTGFAPKVLYMSGYTRNAIVHQGRLDEGIALLEKPFTPAGLLHKVREVLDAPFAEEA